MPGILYNARLPYNTSYTYAGYSVPFVSAQAAGRSVMQLILRTVPSLLGETGQLRRLTSGPVVDAQTFSAWSQTWIEFGEVKHEFVVDQERDLFKRVESCVASLSDAVPVLHQGDEIMDPTGNVWKVGAPGLPIVVRGNDRSGTTDYQLVRELPTRVGPSRGRGGY